MQRSELTFKRRAFAFLPPLYQLATRTRTRAQHARLSTPTVGWFRARPFLEESEQSEPSVRQPLLFKSLLVSRSVCSFVPNELHSRKKGKMYERYSPIPNYKIPVS
ncbi:hypothetical protein ACLKA6_019457 [Drosophila palustris]